MNDFDCCVAARELASMLVSAGFADDARALEAAIEAGSIGTEILMGIRFHVADMVRRLPLDAEAEELAKSIVTAIGKALDA